MKATLMMTTLAMAALAVASIPTASACQGSDPVLHYAVCVVPGATLHFAQDEAADAQAFANEEANDATTFVLWAVEQAPLP